MTKVAQDKHPEICRLYLGGAMIKDICPRFNLSRTSVRRILNLYNIPVIRPRKYSLDETFFETIDSEDKAYFLGLLYADGYHFER